MTRTSLRTRLVPAIIGILAGLATIVLLAHYRLGLLSLVRRQSRDRRTDTRWEDKGPTPLGEKKYTPQGMAWVHGKILWANSWKDERSRVYEIDPASMQVLRHFDMPPEAVHTSGLTWDGKHLWGVDYVSNRAYCLDLEASLATGKVSLVGSFDTTLRGTSACCMVPFEGREYLAISDFMRTRQTIFVRAKEALQAGTAEQAIAFAYRNEGFSQGLEFAGGYLWESENKYGTDVINQMDLATLKATRSARAATIMQYNAPSDGVEDLAWDGTALWTSDESVFRFYRSDIALPAPAN